MKTKSALNKKAVKFITEKLIPFMQREHGNGFAMYMWHATPTSIRGRLILPVIIANLTVLSVRNPAM